MKYGVKEIKNFNECIKNLFSLSVLVRGILVCKKVLEVISVKPLKV